MLYKWLGISQSIHLLFIHMYIEVYYLFTFFLKLLEFIQIQKSIYGLQNLQSHNITTSRTI